MATIINVPKEILLLILENEDISVKDIVNFSSTCKTFRNIIHDNRLWKKKFSQRWPTAKASYNDKMDMEFYHANFADVQGGTKCARKMWHYVSRMSKTYFYCNDRYENKDIFMKDVEDLLLCPDKLEHPLNFSFLFDELVTSIYTQSPRESNLTERYYTEQIFQCLNRYMLKLRWRTVKKMPKQQRRLEDIIVMILQWYHPDKHITYLRIDKFLNMIVQEVLKYLEKENPAHPIFSISPEQFSFWKNNRINEDHWNEITAKPIKCILDKIIVHFNSYKLWMKLNQLDTDAFDYTFREKELHYKHMFWLLSYTCVAKRLGIHFEISVHLPQHSPLDIHLVWKPRSCTENIECFTFYWTEDESNIKISRIRRCQLMAYPTKIFSRTILKVLKEIVGYYCLWPMDFDHSQLNIISTSMRYYDVSICTPPIENFYKRRSPKLKFAIGLVVKHEHEDVYNGYIRDSAGVIIGWHKKCQIKRFRYPDVCCTLDYLQDEYSTHDWKSQPYYVLLIDNDLCYVPQCVITSVCKTKINNAEIGKYFCGFEGTHYVPNEMLARYYPDDAAAVREILNNSNINTLSVRVTKRQRTSL